MKEFFNAHSTLPTQTSYINGQYLPVRGTDQFACIHPANRQQICQVEEASLNDVNAAVAAADAAFPVWSSTPAAERAKILLRAAEILRERNDQLAQLETLDTGKAISETSTVDIITGAEVIEFYAGVAQTLHGDYLDLPPDAFATVRREPLGVCVGIGAWNYPMQIAMWKSGLALACGNTMVFKPSEVTPLTALKLAEIYTEAGMPDGVFNVVQGARVVGEALVAHPDVAKVSITGSVPTGKAVMAASAETLKKVTLELGGKSPIIVFDDADVENAVNAILPANFYSTGQVCSNGTRVFVQRGIYQELLERMVAITKNLSIGDPFSPDTDLGPLVSEAQFKRVNTYLEQAHASKARCVIGGEEIDASTLSDGYYVKPTIFADCTDDMSFVQEEVFGPLMAVLSFDTEEEALQRANATRYGLSGAVFTRDFSRAHRVANAMQAGSVWINHYNILPPSVPFGGYKESGIGRENGMAAVEHYTQLKMVYANLGDVEATY